VQNQGESDIDCGGSKCGACADNKKCGTGTDCTSLVCGGGICQVPTCGDSAKNGAETDLNCGGATCPACADGKTCSAQSDCASTLCSTTCQTGQFWVEYKSDDSSPTDDSIYLELWVYNGTATQHTLSEFKWRYFYTEENATAAEVFDCYSIFSGSTGNGCGLVTAAPGSLNGQHYMEFTANAATWLLPGSATAGGVYGRIRKMDYSAYSETGDWSYDPTKATHQKWSHVVLYQLQGASWVRVWGIEP
jgi:hypothetical protein